MATPPANSSAPTIRGPSRAAPAPDLSPGATLASRYRIVTLLGKGGMGAVYRADDLELGAPVALKLLPRELAADPIALDRFRAEVRLARQISHPNIVRVYDIVTTAATGNDAPTAPVAGQREGGGPPAFSPSHTFLSMEFVDGEDLASLLRRIGRLPHDKAVQIARQLCFGLAAAHDHAVIHRDLKPANVMIDGRGNARIMDFGVAGLAHDLMAKGDITSGTPAYMAPEQIAGKEVSKKSDIYSLGLVLYELFTGKPAISAQSLADIRALHESSTRPESLSRHVADIDPAVERIILRCLELEPADRPPSAMSIAAALPGGDPLAAALAAGETPSPDLIAASGAGRTLSPAAAWARAAAIFAMVLAIILLTAPWTMVARIKPAKSPEVLQDRAQEILKALGYTQTPADSARGLSARFAYISLVNNDPKIKDKTERLRTRPGPYEFWYRQSPVPIDAETRDGIVRFDSPMASRPGEVLVRSDTAGRLEYFAAMPARKRYPSTAEIPDATIAKLFEFADLDLSRFTAAQPIYRPFIPCDSMRSWTGDIPEQPDLPLRVHLGAVEGKVVYFSVSYPWSVAAVEAGTRAPEPKSWIDYASALVIALIFIFTGRLVWTNLRSGRGDRASALRVSVAMFCFALLNLVFAQHRFPGFREILTAGGGFAPAAFAAVEFWLFYTALEPYARRVYPQSLISWTRLLRGQWNDPLVGRHILTGLLLGSVSILCTALLVTFLHSGLRHDSVIALYGRTGGYLGGLPVIAALTADTFTTALMLGAGSMLPLVMNAYFFGRRWVGYLGLIISFAAIESGTLRANPVDGTISLIIAMIPILAIPSGGLLALIATHVAVFLGQMLPIGLDWTHWFTAPVLLPAGLLAGITILAARAAASGRPSA